MKNYLSVLLQQSPKFGFVIPFIFLGVLLFVIFFIVRKYLRGTSAERKYMSIVIALAGIAIIIISQTVYKDAITWEGKIRNMNGYVYFGVALLVLGCLLLASLTLGNKPLQENSSNSNGNNSIKTPATSVLDELAKLHELKEKGVITPEEFEKQKKKML